MIVLFRPTARQDFDASIGIDVKSYVFPPPPNQLPYSLPHPPSGRIPSLSWMCLRRLAEFPDQIELNGIRLYYDPVRSDILQLLVDGEPVDPRLWATVVQIYDNLPDNIRSYSLPLSDRHIPLLQRIRSTTRFTLITVLDLPKCTQLSDETIILLSPLHALVALDGSETDLTAYGIKNFTQTLQWVDDGPQRRGPWRLRILRLRHCSKIDNTVYPALLKFPLLSVLDLVGTACTLSNETPFQHTDTLHFFYPHTLIDAVKYLATLGSSSELFGSENAFTISVNTLEHPPKRSTSLKIVTEDSFVLIPPSPLTSLHVGSTAHLDEANQKKSWNSHSKTTRPHYHYYEEKSHQADHDPWAEDFGFAYAGRDYNSTVESSLSGGDSEDSTEEDSDRDSEDHDDGQHDECDEDLNSGDERGHGGELENGNHELQRREASLEREYESGTRMEQEESEVVGLELEGISPAVVTQGEETALHLAASSSAPANTAKIPDECRRPLYISSAPGSFSMSTLSVPPSDLFPLSSSGATGATGELAGLAKLSPELNHSASSSVLRPSSGARDFPSFNVPPYRRPTIISGLPLSTHTMADHGSSLSCLPVRTISMPTSGLLPTSASGVSPATFYSTSRLSLSKKQRYSAGCYYSKQETRRLPLPLLVNPCGASEHLTLVRVPGLSPWSALEAVTPPRAPNHTKQSKRETAVIDRARLLSQMQGKGKIAVDQARIEALKNSTQKNKNLSMSCAGAHVPRFCARNPFRKSVTKSLRALGPEELRNSESTEEALLKPISKVSVPIFSKGAELPVPSGGNRKEVAGIHVWPSFFPSQSASASCIRGKRQDNMPGFRPSSSSKAPKRPFDAIDPDLRRVTKERQSTKKIKKSPSRLGEKTRSKDETAVTEVKNGKKDRRQSAPASFDWAGWGKGKKG